jgi:hypothetical protein
MRIFWPAALIGSLLLLGATPNPTPTSSSPSSATGAPTASEILERMTAAAAGLNALSVPIHFDVQIHKPLSIELPLDGTGYYQRPDKSALVMQSVPAIAQAFKKTYGGMGTPQTWPQQYNLTLIPPDQTSDSNVYELKGTPKNAGSNLDHVLFDVDRATAAVVRARWYYHNGATIDMAIDNTLVSQRYHLPKTQTLDIVFPSYAGHAVAQFGDYSINQPIPASVWSANAN